MGGLYLGRGLSSNIVNSVECTNNICTHFLFIWFVIVVSVILSSSANKNALLITTDNPASPSNGRNRLSFINLPLSGTIHRYWSLGSIKIFVLPICIL